MSISGSRATVPCVGDQLVLEGEHDPDRLQRGGGAERVAERPLHAGHRRYGVTKDGTKRTSLGKVVERC